MRSRCTHRFTIIYMDFSTGFTKFDELFYKIWRIRIILSSEENSIDAMQILNLDVVIWFEVCFVNCYSLCKILCVTNIVSWFGSLYRSCFINRLSIISSNLLVEKVQWKLEKCNRYRGGVRFSIVSSSNATKIISMITISYPYDSYSTKLFWFNIKNVRFNFKLIKFDNYIIPPAIIHPMLESQIDFHAITLNL